MVFRGSRTGWCGSRVRPDRAQRFASSCRCIVVWKPPSSRKRCRLLRLARAAYSKRPFAGPAQVLEYVGRYTHRVAISNNRLLSLDNERVRFRWRDYRDDNRQKTMSLSAEEFIRRFLIHVLPDGFHRIRYFGFLSNCHRAQKLALCRKLLEMTTAEPAADPPADYRDRFEALTGLSLRACPHCHTGIM